MTSSPAATNPALRWTFVATITIAALAHVPVISPHLEEAPYMGVLFILLTASCFGLAAAVAVTNHPNAYRAATLVCGAAVLGYAATRLVAFPQLSDDVGYWFEPLGVVSVLTESAVLLLALVALRRVPAHV